MPDDDPTAREAEPPHRTWTEVGVLAAGGALAACGAILAAGAMLHPSRWRSQVIPRDETRRAVPFPAFVAGVLLLGGAALVSGARELISIAQRRRTKTEDVPPTPRSLE